MKFWRDTNGMMATEAFLVLLFLIGFGSFAYYFLFHYTANSELWDTIMRIWNMIYAVYNGEAMDGMSGPWDKRRCRKKPRNNFF